MREDLARRYLAGNGIEIGASFWPLRVPPGAAVRYVDYVDRQTLVADNAALDRQPGDTANTTGYAVFGQVVAGMDTVDKIAAVPLGDHGPFPGAGPVTPIVISHVVVQPDAAP